MDYQTVRLLLVLVGVSAIRVHGDYQVLVSVHTLVLLESRCAECYGGGGGSIQWDYCCDGSNTDSCPDSCDIQLRFCDLGDLSQFNVADRSVFGTNCVQNSLSDYFDDLLGFDLKAGEIYPDYDERSLQGGIVFTTSVAYNGTGQWKGALLVIPVVDRDPNEFDDLIDYFIIPINISAGSLLTNNFTGRYNHVQLELTIEVACTAQSNRDENCVCLPGFTGPLCEENVNDCIGVVCSGRGVCVDAVNGFRCECSPGFTGQLCEIDIDDCIGVTCVNRGQCVDGVQSFTCNCDPGYTGAVCEIEMTSSSSPRPSAIIGGVVGGVVISFLLVILILLLVIIRWRAKSFS